MSFAHPDAIAGAFAEAWNRRDPDALAALFDDDAEFVNVVGLWWHSRGAIREAHAYGLSRIFNASTLDVDVVRTKQVSADVAVVHARMRLSGQRPHAGIVQPMTRTTIMSFVVHRSGDGWSCVSAHNTDVIPGRETNVVDESGQLVAVHYGEVIEHDRAVLRGLNEADSVDLSADESFPASDAPAWGPLQLGAPSSHDTK